MVLLNEILGLLFSSGGSLKQKIFRGGTWLSLGTIATNILGIIKLAILGRLLLPEDFGLMGIALVSLRWLEAFTESGFNAALIHKKGDVYFYLDTAFSLQLFRSVTLALTLIVTGDWIANWIFDRPDAGIIIKSVAAVVFFRGLVNPAVLLLKKEMNFRAEFYWRITGYAFGVPVAVILGVLYRNVWALVGSLIAANFAMAVTSYVVAPYRPKLEFSFLKAKELYSYGRSIFLSNLFVFFRETTDSFLLVKLCGIESLGYYQMALQFSYNPSAQVGLLIRGVMFPAFASLTDMLSVQKIFLKTLTWVSALVVPFGFFLFAFSEHFVLLAMGPNWQSVTPTFAILIWASVLVILNGVAYSCLVGIGKPNLAAFSNALNLLGLSLFFLPPLREMQEYGMGLVVTISLVLSTLIQFIMVIKSLKLNMSQFALSWKIALLGIIPFVFLSIMTGHISVILFYGMTFCAFLFYFLVIIFFARIELNYKKL